MDRATVEVSEAEEPVQSSLPQAEVLCGSASLPLQPRVRIPAADAESDEEDDGEYGSG